MTRRSGDTGFTLIELLVVIGLIGGALYIFASRSLYNESAALREAETSVAALLRTTRSVAVLNAAPARLLVCLEPAEADSYLALLAVVVRNDAGTSWTLAARPVCLPEPVRVVPAADVPAAPGTAWPAAAVSAFSGTEAVALEGLPVGRYAYVEFSATGTTGAAKKLLLLAMRDRSRSEVVFVTPERSSAFLLRTSGAHTLLRDPGSL